MEYQTAVAKMASMESGDSKEDTGFIRPISPIKSNFIETHQGSHCSSQRIGGRASALKVHVNDIQEQLDIDIGQ